MSTHLELKVTGIQTIVQVLTGLAPEVSSKIAIAAMRKAMAPVARSAAGNVPIRSGALYFAIHTRVATADKFDTRRVRKLFYALAGGGISKSETAAVGSVLPIRSDPKARAMWESYYHKKHTGTGIRHGHFVEFGRKGKYTKHPFLLPALESNSQQIVTTLESELRAGIDRYLVANAKGAA